ncbi:MAG: hypothetical protein H6Q69_4249 [Firmicutes bacterium]|nr:hypothetical protein [Bacillota bacterium]
MKNSIGREIPDFIPGLGKVTGFVLRQLRKRGFVILPFPRALLIRSMMLLFPISSRGLLPQSKQAVPEGKWDGS